MKELLFDDSEKVFFFHDQQLIAVNLDRLAAVLAEQNTVTNLDANRVNFALVVFLARANSQNLALQAFQQRCPE